jgi:hypothetical protein
MFESVVVTDTPRLTQYLLSGRYSGSRILHQSELIVHIVKKYMLIGHIMTAPPSVLSPSSILPSVSCQCAFSPSCKNSARVAKVLKFIIFKELRRSKIA